MTSGQNSEATFREATIADCEEVARVYILTWKGSFRSIVPQALLDRMMVVQRAEAFSQGTTAAFYKMYVAEVLGSGIVGFADFGDSREEMWGTTVNSIRSTSCQNFIGAASGIDRSNSASNVWQPKAVIQCTVGRSRSTRAVVSTKRSAPDRTPKKDPHPRSRLHRAGLCLATRYNDAV